MSGIFGGRDPFDDPFFTRPVGSLFGSSRFAATAPSGDLAHGNRLKGPIIEEIDCEEANMSGIEEDPEQSPLVEHPEDQADEHRKSKGESKGKELSCWSDHNKAQGEESKRRGVSFQSVTYGGINGAYYTASTTRRTGNHRVVMEDRKEADRTTGQATHRISKGIHDKGHSVTRKLNSDRKVDTMQTLHNLDEDELAGFEQSWKGNADMHLPEWDNAFDLHSSPGVGSSRLTSWGGWGLPYGVQFRGATGLGPEQDALGHSAGGGPKKVVTIPIE